mgnify:CR=1 FL=1
MSWSESVDEALCVGWIDAVRRRIDDAGRSELTFKLRGDHALGEWSCPLRNARQTKAEVDVTFGAAEPALDRTLPGFEGLVEPTGRVPTDLFGRELVQRDGVAKTGPAGARRLF